MTPIPTATRPPRTAGPSLAAHRRRQRSRRRALRRSMIALLVIAVLAGAGWLVGFSPVLAVRQVSVSGARVLGADDIRQVAQVPIGLPLIRQDADGIAQRVATLRQVETVHVSRDWPSTLAIQVVERKPVLGVRQPGGFVLVDRSGVAFSDATELPAGVQLAAIDPDDADLLGHAATVATALPTALTRQVSLIRASSPDVIRIELGSGVVVTWGTSDESALKARITLALLKHHPKAIDVSAPHSPAIR